MKVKSESEVAQLCPTLSDPMDCSLASLPMGFSRQEYWSGVPSPSPGKSIGVGCHHLLQARLYDPPLNTGQALALTEYIHASECIRYCSAVFLYGFPLLELPASASPSSSVEVLHIHYCLSQTLPFPRRHSDFPSQKIVSSPCYSPSTLHSILLLCYH